MTSKYFNQSDLSLNEADFTSPFGCHRFSHAAARPIAPIPRCIGVNRADTHRCTALGSTAETTFLSAYLDSLTPLSRMDYFQIIFKIY